MCDMNSNCDIMEDYNLNFNVLTVMQCVQELKTWQESQQPKLLDNPTMDTLTNEMKNVLKSFDIPENVQEHHDEDIMSSYSEIDEELLKHFNCKNNLNSLMVSNLQTLSPNKNVEENKVVQFEDNKNNIVKDNQLKHSNENEDNINKSKKPYLKKGTGLTRYGLNLEEVKKKVGKLKFHKPKIPPKIKVPRKCLNQVNTFPKTEFVNNPIKSTRLDLKKVSVVDSWNRYEPKLLLSDEDNSNNKEQNELRAFEILEERANNSNLNASSPTVRQLLETGQHAKNNKEIQTSGLVRSLNFDKINTSTPQKDANESNSNLVSYQRYDILDLPINVVKHSNTNDNENNFSLDHVILTENEKKYLENYTKTSGVVKTVHLEQSFDTELLSKRLEELEFEVEKFRSENIKLMKLQQEFDIERQTFFKCKEDFMKKLNEEKKKDEDKLADERKKFLKEKLLFEKNTRELKNKPNRQEREEIKKLNDQLTNLKEEFNKKEARWASGQARLRTQLKQLENSNTTLRKELELFRKSTMNKKVTFKTSFEKQAQKNTNIIHNVNTELSKLTFDNVLTMIDPKTTQIPASILRKPSITSIDYYDSSEELSSNENQFLDNPTITDNNKDIPTESNGTNSSQYNSCDVIRENVLDDGRKEILYSNGNLKKVSADGTNVKVIYYNGDVKETREDSERYYFAKNKTYHTTFNNGLEIIEFPNGQIEKHFKDGKVEIEYVDGKKHTVYPDRKEVWNYLDGSILTIDPNGQRELILLNGQREIHTDEYKKRVYPDGTTKIVYPDGSHETKYPDGRVRKKNKDGILTLDTSISS